MADRSLHQYRILSTLGKGAFGITYKAQDLEHDRWVAIKVLSLKQIDDWKAVELFEREAKVLSRLNHPGIPNYIDYFYVDTRKDRLFCLVQELVEGRSLANWVKQGWRAEEEQVRDIAVQVLEILDYLHWQNPPVIHRDIKPQNIILRQDGKVFLVDFGAVRDLYRNSLIKGGTFVGTLGYMPPEQFRGQAFLASDLYGLGTTLLFVLAHRSPEELPHVRMKIDFRKVVQVSESFAGWLEKMIEPALEDRYKSAREALAVLKGKRKLDRKVSHLTILPQRRQPKGSRVKVQKKLDRFDLKIPPSGVNFNNLGFFLFVAFWDLIIFGMVLIAILQQTWQILFFVGLHALVGVGLTIGSLWALASSARLTIDRERFRFCKHCLGVTYQENHGLTSELELASLEVNADEYGRKKVRCMLWEHAHNYEIGERLTPVEKRWLAEEISAFLQHLKQ
ncbi:MAG: protein kinase [Cyanobacteria bacterium SID2]|nr:protein kinase [Cyanobacteria bacterium SID2]